MTNRKTGVATKAELERNSLLQIKAGETFPQINFL